MNSMLDCLSSVPRRGGRLDFSVNMPRTGALLASLDPLAMHNLAEGETLVNRTLSGRDHDRCV